MKNKFARVRLFLLLLSLVVTAATAATPVCQSHYPSPAATEAMLTMADRTAQQLDALPGTQVAIIARSGQNLSRYGLRHSHVAFVVREADGQWRVRHLLNHCKSRASELYREGLANFIGETAQTGDLRLGVLAPSLQQRLYPLLTTQNGLMQRLHEPRYSAVAYPFTTGYQNSNQWVLEIIAAALAAADGPMPDNRNKVQAWLRKVHYKPSSLHLSLGQRFGARFTVTNATTTDHPWGERISGNYSVVTVESIFDFLLERGLLIGDQSIAHQPPPSSSNNGASP
ncbi:hypothetical protein B398_06115 [Xylella fastidiosa 32]|uniref:DUF2145 domain-containing protein n=1 Tax=Xylella fastidiosa TaxID=2371 RepID=UPI0003D38233|nr:DUF2145 domain-containing protein [Xylella fastidiosa]ALQ96986.1 DUF2145 domain-containing protein [Xylella fastidiosa]ETE31615.1 hypothetical protein B398_06115 [Xylella fastidiosa 32]